MPGALTNPARPPSPPTLAVLRAGKLPASSWRPSGNGQREGVGVRGSADQVNRIKVSAAPTLQIKLDSRAVDMLRESFYLQNEEVVDGFLKPDVRPQCGDMRVNEQKEVTVQAFAYIIFTVKRPLF